MTYNENRPGACDAEPVEEVRPELEPTVDPSCRRTSDLEIQWRALAACKLPLPDLDPIAFAFYTLGHVDGFRTAQALDADEIAAERDRADRAEFIADRWYEIANNPGKNLSEVRARREMQALDEADARGQLVTAEDVFNVILHAARPPRSAA